MQSLVAQINRADERRFISCIDAEVAQRMFAGDMTLFALALSLLLRDHGEFGVPVTAFGDEQTARSELQTRLHALRGGSGMIGATCIMRLAGEAETAIEANLSTDIVRPILAQLTSAFVQLRDEAVSWLAGRPQLEARVFAAAVAHPTMSENDVNSLYAMSYVSEGSPSPTATSPLAATSALRILLVDDHDIVQLGITSLIEQAGNMAVIECVGTGEAAVLTALRLCPDVIIMDLVLPELNGLDAARRILAQRPQTHIIVLSACCTSEHLHRAVEAGARGYVVKTSAGACLIPAIRAVAAGNQYISQGIVPVEELGGRPALARIRRHLSAREREVLKLLVAGQSSVDIGLRLSLSSKSIDTYRHRIMVKLGVGNRAALIRVAIEYDLIAV